mmetsp:Transcript_129347/g.228740  ORF Transcript_129347/g.228740 Transcript_129347/m.228740 type:complete len:319 (-) Transcript_129347:90-1046(-)
MSRLMTLGATGLGTLALSMWYLKGRRSAKNAAFVLVPPRANNAQVRNLVAEALRGDGMRIVGEGEIPIANVSKGLLFEKHHIAVASKAALTKPSQLELSSSEKTRFRDSFGMSWDQAVGMGLVFNAVEACAELACTADELEAAWLECRTNGKFARLADSFECGYVQVEGTDADLRRRRPVFVINGFFAKVRHDFIAAGSGVHYYQVDLDESKVSWASFHDQIAGLGDLHLHASASPFQALATRMNWLGTRCQDDSYCQTLLQAGVKESTIHLLFGDPEVQFRGGGRGRVFEAFKGLGAKPSVEYAVTLQEGMVSVGNH